MVVLDSVSAVIYPLLGGRQSEGELLTVGAVLGMGIGAGHMWM